ncbi:Uncharacterized protein Fot_02464 [Forsythia ovata]|uniref:Uncharacterized protein n=1 Tax=Forsythia ovata TaxID=205694 RepID=A0ABD1X7T4_9LAMI
MEVIQKLDLKSSEDQKEYNSEDEGYLSENSSSVYLSNNNTDFLFANAGLDAPLLLEPPQNEGSEADEVDSFGCCSCFSFINFFKGTHFRKYEEETDGVAEVLYDKSNLVHHDILEENDFMNEFNRPVKQVEIPLPKGS